MHTSVFGARSSKFTWTILFSLLATSIGLMWASQAHARTPVDGYRDPPLTASLVASFDTFGSASSILGEEIDSLIHKGVPTERAIKTLAVEAAVERAGLVSKAEIALGATYGGAWFEPMASRLDIGIASEAKRGTAEAMLAGTELASVVTFVRVRRTWSRLLAIQASWNGRLAALLSNGLAETSLSPRQDAVRVMVGASVPIRERSTLDRDAASFHGGVIFTVSRFAGLRLTKDATKTLCNKFASKKAYCDKTITAGVTIENEADERCTAGPQAILTDLSKETLETFLLTAGHCINALAEKWLSYNRKAEPKEIGEAVDLLDNKEADVGVIKILNSTEGGYWTEAGNTPVYADVAGWAQAGEPNESLVVGGDLKPVQGKTNCFEGQTTGELCGTIASVEASTEVSGLAEDEGVTAESGDSGAPFISTDPANTSLLEEGTLVGELEDGNVIYEPLETSFALLALKLELLTTSNETRKPCPMMD